MPAIGEGAVGLSLMRIIAATLLMLSLAAPVAAGPLDDARAAIKVGNYATAVRVTRSLAEQGDAEAQTLLGGIYSYGVGVPQDHAEALKWYRLAANQNFAEAQFSLGAVYTSGEGVPRNYAEALKWYRLAADQNFAEAQFNLGLMYAQGNGVVPPDNVLAHMWLNLSAAQGLKQAETSRDRVQRLMTPAQIAEAQKLAREWKPTR
jgi:uncharacterized protein